MESVVRDPETVSTTLRAVNVELDRRVFDLHALLKAGSALHSSLEIDPLCALLSAMIRERTGFTTVAILLHQTEMRRVRLRGGSGLPEGSEAVGFPADDGLLWRLLLAGEPFSVIDLSGNARFPDAWRKFGLDVLGGHHWVPMVLPGRVVGLLSLGPASTEALTPSQIEFLASLAGQAAVAFHTALLYESNAYARRELDRSLHKLSMLFDVTRALGAVSDLTRLVRLILERAIKSVEAEKGSLMLLDDTTDELVVRVVYGLPDAETERKINDGEVTCTRLRRGEGVAGKVVATGKAVRVHDVGQEQGWSARGGAHVHSILCVPLLVDDEAIGVINITNRKGLEPFRDEDEEILAALASQAAVAIARTRLYEAAITDGMTKLFIRRFITHRLVEEAKKSRRYGAPLSVIMCDIDHFKRVNDTYGHPAGDAVIIHVASILKAGVRTDVDAAGRFGGEEFLLLLPHTTGAAAMIAAERLREKIAGADVDIGEGKTVAVTMSFGVAEFDRDGEENADDVVKRADTALYASKHGGRNRVTLAESPAGVTLVVETTVE